jgi:ankyrin repeat protein
MTAAKSGQLEIVKFFITEHKVDINQITESGTAIVLASENGHNEIVEYLRAHSAASDIANFSTLEAAVKSGNIAALQQAVENFPEEVVKHPNLLALCLENAKTKFATLSRDLYEATQVAGLIDSQKAENTRNEQSKLAKDCVDIIKKIHKNASLDALFSYENYTPMIKAIGIGNVDLVEALGRKAVKPRHMKIAIEKGNFEIAMRICNAVSNYNKSYDEKGNLLRRDYYESIVSQKNESDKTALYIAVEQLVNCENYTERLSIIEYMLKDFQLDPDMPSLVHRKTYTPLFFAIDHGLFDVVKELVDRAGIIINDPKKRGWHIPSGNDQFATDLNAGFHDEAHHHITTPLYQAIKKFKPYREKESESAKNSRKILNYLIINGTKSGHLDLNLHSDMGPNKCTPLLQAISENMPGVVELLIHYGADLNIEGMVENKKYKPIDFAKEKHFHQIVKFLEAAEALDNHELPDLEGFAESSVTALTNRKALDLQKSETVTTEDYMELKSTVVKLESMVQYLWPMIEAHEKIKSEVLAIKADPYKYAFYQELRWELTSGYAVAQLILTGQVKLAPEELGVNLGTCGIALSAIGEHIPIFGLVAKVAGAAMVYGSEVKRKLMLEHFKSFACDYVDFVRISEAVARKIAQSNLHIEQKQEGIFAKIKGCISEHLDLANILRNFGEGENYSVEVLHGKKDAKIIAGLIMGKILESGSKQANHVSELTRWVSNEIEPAIMIDVTESNSDNYSELFFAEQSVEILGIHHEADS